MKRTKEQKAITLIALIITIVILLILAAVAISSITNDGILSYAQNAAKDYNQAVKNEQNMLEQYENYLRAVEPEVGQFVEYDVSYTDMYSGITYDNSETGKYGWRYLGKDNQGNQLIVSTGIPAILYYDNRPETLPTWWATEEEVQSDTGIYKTNAVWDYANDGDTNRYSSYGLRYKFTSIPLTYQESGIVSEKNTGIFNRVGAITSGTLGQYAFYDTNYTNKIVGVHNLTLAELNEAVNGANKNNNQEEIFLDLTGDALGLFNMRHLTGYGENTTYFYWLATPDSSNRYGIHVVNWLYGLAHSGSDSCGVRPVVVLSGVTFAENEVGNLEIQ